MQDQDKFITLSGLKFHYREWGNPEAPPLILLHGFTAHARTWDPVARALQNCYRVLALDQRGHGETDWAAEYSWSTMCEDIGTFAHTLGLEKFSLLGQSMGGYNAYRYAGTYPDKVERLIIVDSGPPIPKSSDPLTEIPWSYEFDTKQEMVNYLRADVTHFQSSELLKSALYYARQLDNGRWISGHDQTGFNTIFSDSSFPTPEELWKLLSGITCPTLVVRGAESATFSREQAQRMVREIPDCRMVEISGAGHTVQWDKPGEFIKAVREFLLAGTAGVRNDGDAFKHRKVTSGSCVPV